MIIQGFTIVKEVYDIIRKTQKFHLLINKLLELELVK
jgi:hypothetical protein